jgi:hypothetical protein
MNPKAFLLLPPLLLAAGGTLQARDDVRFGAALALDVPCGDLKADLNDKPGLGGAFQVTFRVAPRVLFRPRVDLDLFQVSSYRENGDDTRVRNDLGSAGLGADLLYSFSGNPDRGPYGLAGLGALRWFQTYTTTSHDGGTDSASNDTHRNRASAWAALGLGYQLNRWVGLELRSTASSYDSPAQGGLTAPLGQQPTNTRTAVITQLAVTGRW